MTESQLRDLLAGRLQAVRERIQTACQRAGRSPAAVTLVAVTKTVAVPVAGLLPELGVLHLGESRPQELWRKTAVMPASVHWHLIGHLQRNKIERTLPLVEMIHSVDSARLLEALEEEGAKRQQPVRVLLEVNASREANKHGFAPELLPGLLPRINDLRHVHVSGLMTMAAFDEGAARCRPTFALVRQLRDRLTGKLKPPHRLEQLSMGMSNDYEVAVEEGATLVRIGSALFQGLPP